jgi:hypothetical protein
LNLDINDLIEECTKSEMFAKSIAMNIAIQWSRQGCKDEKLVFDQCNNLLKNTNIQVLNLGNNKIRPCKDGTILCNVKQKTICLKSFDGQVIIDGNLIGYITHKLSMGL